MGETVHDESSDPAFAPIGAPEPEPSPSFVRRWWVLFALTGVIALATAATVVGYVVNRDDSMKWAVGVCVSSPESFLVEYGCDQDGAVYRIAYRERLQYPIEAACAKYPDVTKAAAQPDQAEAKLGTVLCLTPTRVNFTDPGALRAEDCIDVKDAGKTIKRGPCDPVELRAKVIATELHMQIPVTDRACEAHPATRVAFAQTSLGGRALVVCAISADPNNVDFARVDSCVSKPPSKLVPCGNQDADRRVLSTKVVHGQANQPQCPDVFGANASFSRGNEKTDLVMILCLGPVDTNNSLYARVGDCIASPANAGPASETRRVNCADPSATLEVTDRHTPDDGICAADWSSMLTYPGGATNGLTICLRSR